MLAATLLLSEQATSSPAALRQTSTVLAQRLHDLVVTAKLDPELQETLNGSLRNGGTVGNA
jgi:hypothetical protein